jgi:hypothetical protein
MTSFDDLLATITVNGPLPVTGDSSPLGAAWLPGPGRGVDLAAHGYVEQEYLVRGQADDWTWDDRLQPVPAGPQPFTTRILLRRPADPAAFSGAVYLEPNHADYDRSLTWSATAPWLVRSGHAHVGVTQEIAALPDLARWDPARYRALSIPRPGQRWEITGLVAALIKGGALGGLAGYPVSRVIMSGWSQTGTFCRTFLGEGFHARSQAGGRPAVDGYVICISSGGAARPGYGVLRPPAAAPLDDPRRTIGAHGVPVIELLSEGESETHRAVLRPDSDGTGPGGTGPGGRSRGEPAPAATGLSPDEIVSNAAVLMFGGIETTEGMIANAMLHLLSSPGELELVRADRGLIPAAIEESLRLEPAAAVVDRYATRGTELGGAQIRAGDQVTVSIAGANRDPVVFGDPDRFDIRRPNSAKHLAFAHGPHFCLGAHLARLEAQIAAATLLDLLPELRLDDRYPATPHGLVFRKPTDLRVRWSSAIS